MFTVLSFPVSENTASQATIELTAARGKSKNNYCSCRRTGKRNSQIDSISLSLRRRAPRVRSNNNDKGLACNKVSQGSTPVLLQRGRRRRRAESALIPIAAAARPPTITRSHLPCLHSAQRENADHRRARKTAARIINISMRALNFNFNSW